MPVAVELKSPREIGWMREAGRVVSETLRVLVEAVRLGISTAELDRIAESEILKRKALPAFKGYRSFPATLCASINEEVVHGIPSAKRVLKEGDILSMDLGAIVRGYYGDAALTLGVGKVSAKAQELMDVTRDSLELAIQQCRPGRRLGDIGHAVQKRAEGAKMGVVREFVGHGIGRALHEDPAVPNIGEPGKGLRLDAGMILAIEPMVTLGTHEVRVLKDGWTAVTVDGKLSAHFEHTVAITDKGPEVLTGLNG